MAEVQKQSDGFRWWVLGATAMGMFAYGYGMLILSLLPSYKLYTYIYYKAYDNPVALQRQMLKEYNLSNVQYNLLYSVYSFPNMVLPAIAGIMSDKIGYDWLVIFFFGLMVIAQGLFVFGCYLNGIFWILLTARCIFGIGAESHALVETPLIYDYFKGKELAFALALHLSMGRAGSSVNDICTYLAYTKFDGSTNDKIVFATMIGLFILFVMWLIIIIMILVHRIKQRAMKILKKKLKKEQQKLANNDAVESSLRSAQISFDNASFASAADLLPDSPTMQNKQSLVKPLISNSALEAENVSVTSFATAASKMKISDIKDFDIVFWLLVWNCAIMYAIVLSWMNIGSDFLQVTYGYSHGTSNAILTIPYSLAGILQPIWGYISDKVGYRSQALFISSLLFVGSHYTLGWVQLDKDPIYIPIAALTALGLGYSIFTAVIWPCFPLVVPPRAIGTAYGIPTSGYNLILTVYYVLVGYFTSSVDDSNKYLQVQYFLLITSIATVGTSLLLIWMDKRTGWRLLPSAFAAETDTDKDLE